MKEYGDRIGYNEVKALEETLILFQERLVEQYCQYVPKQILYQYTPPEITVTVNDDSDMFPIELKLPEPPELHTIDGFGLPAKDQFFRIQQMPVKLIDLVKTSNDFFEVIQKLDKNRTRYRNEILWIQQQWHYRLNGYWFWNNGTPTYIDGWHFFYCNYVPLRNEGLPKFNYRDRLFFIFARYCYTTTEAPFFFRVQRTEPTDEDPAEYWYFSDKDSAEKYRDYNDLPYEIEQGFWMIDYNHRTCYGFNYPKHRREGATSKGGGIGIEILTRIREADGLLLSMTGENAEQTFEEKYKFPLQNMAFFFLPELGSSLNSKKGGIDFNVSSFSDKKKIIGEREGLVSTIHPQTSASDIKSDGAKYHFVHGDEVGKGVVNSPYNCLKRHDVIKKTVAQRPAVHGLMINTSTADDTRGDFGRNYKTLCQKSHWHQRTYEEGITDSGLFNLFIPAYINVSMKMTDKYGMPLIGHLTKQQQRETGERFGAKIFIEGELSKLLASGDEDAYYHAIREFPTRYRHCFLASTEDAQFDVLEVNERINKIDMMPKSPVRRGNFRWVRGWGSTVEFVDSSTGKFLLSFYPARPNNIHMKNGKVVAGNKDIFVAACDPFRFDVTRKKRESKGAGVVYMKRDFMIDPEDKPKEDWVTDRFVCTYVNKVPSEEYNEDMLMMSVFFGCEMFPEMNEELVYKYFRATKFSGLLGYLFVDGKKKELPGVYISSANKPLGFRLWKLKIERNIRHELHRDVLQDVADIEGLDDMKNYDLFAAGVSCFLAIYYSKDGLANAVDRSTSSTVDNAILQWIYRGQGISYEP